jgi:acyl-CoA thioester hydrolase
VTSPLVHATRTRVRYAETDASGIVYYANYFIYFEVGRLALFKELGLPYDRRLPIVETACRYHASARFDDEIEIRTTVDELRSKGFRLGHRVLRLPTAGAVAQPELLVEGHTSMVTTDEAGTPVPLPPDFEAAFRPYCRETWAGDTK